MRDLLARISDCAGAKLSVPTVLRSLSLSLSISLFSYLCLSINVSEILLVPFVPGVCSAAEVKTRS